MSQGMTFLSGQIRPVSTTPIEKRPVNGERRFVGGPIAVRFCMLNTWYKLLDSVPWDCLYFSAFPPTIDAYNSNRTVCSKY